MHCVLRGSEKKAVPEGVRERHFKEDRSGGWGDGVNYARPEWWDFILSKIGNH